MGAVRRVVCGKLEGDPADPEPGEGSQRSGRESETGTDSSSPDTGAGTKRGWPTSRGALQWALCQPQVLVCSGPHAWWCWFQCSCTDRGTRDVLKPLSALTPAGWSSRLPLWAGPRGIPGPGLSSRADPWLLLFPEPEHA